MSQKNLKIFTEIILILLGLAFSAAFFVTLQLHNDNLQILDKAIKFVQEGTWTHHGNFGSGVGFVPGTFLTAISAVPMKIYFSPYSAMAVIALFHLISLGLLANIARDFGGKLFLLDLLLLYWLNPWRVEQSELYNPGYLFLFSGLHLWTSMKMKEKNFGLTVLHVLAIGLCAQLHYSFMILAIASLLLLSFRFLKVHWGGFFVGVALVLASLAPYFLEYLNNPDLKVTVTGSSKAFLGRNFLLVYPVLKAIMYWFRYGAIYYGRHIFTEINFDWISEGLARQVVSTTFHSLKWVVAAVTLWLSLRWNFQWMKSVWARHPFRRNQERTESPPLERFQWYAFYMFVAMIVSAGLSPVEFNHWHLILCFPVVALLLTIYFHSLREKLSRKKFALLYVGVFVTFCLFDTFAALGSRVHSYKNNFHRDFMIYSKLRKVE